MTDTAFQGTAEQPFNVTPAGKRLVALAEELHQADKATREATLVRANRRELLAQANQDVRAAQAHQDDLADRLALLIAHPALNPDDWTIRLAEGGRTYPFTEAENCNITGLGHQDLAAFADAINAYDEEATGSPTPPDDRWTAGDISHQWGQLNDTGEWVELCVSGTPGAIAITTLWGAR